ncbi:MAG: flagellar export chaperone FliS [Colwellia sp.]|nr:flagellar export chaperone FliS [Colwellia sp.]
MRNNLKTYQKISKESNLIASDPHQIISLLYNGIFESLKLSKIAITNKNLDLKSKQLAKAVNIFRSLDDSLDFESEPAISKNFSELYLYCISTLADVSVSLDSKKIDEVIDLIEPLSSAWKNIPEDEKQKGLVLIQAKESA